MSRSIYINLPAKNVAAAREFYTKLGFGVNEQFSNDQNAVMMVDDNIALMLVAEDFFKANVSGRDIANTASVREVSLAIQMADRKEVDTMFEAALAAGAKSHGETMDDYGMYSRGLTDLDGHRLDLLCMAG